jgi:hypothetical protein
MDVAKGITTSAVAGGVVTGVGVKLGLIVAGFSSHGVLAGSMAAGIQAGIGNVAAGSLFATC